MKIKEYRRELKSLSERVRQDFFVIKYPEKIHEKATFYCVRHVFEYNPVEFLTIGQCPVCEYEKDISRKSMEYNKFYTESLKNKDGMCELTGVTRNLELHHLYGMSVYPEVAYSIQNGILISEKIHRLYHAKYYSANPYTFISFLEEIKETGTIKVTSERIDQLIDTIISKMNFLESKIANARGISNSLKNDQPKLQKTITDYLLLDEMRDRASIRMQHLDHGETLNLNENVALVKIYGACNVLYLNDFGNWLECNPGSRFILENAFHSVMKKKKKEKQIREQAIEN